MFILFNISISSFSSVDIQKSVVKFLILKNRHTQKCRKPNSRKKAGGFMESFLHKHYKNNLICEGMQILSCGDLLTITAVETEVDLRKKFDTSWERSIIVDILAQTNKGYIAIEIYNTNPKLWAALSHYYKDISGKVVNFFEVKICNVANQPPVWRDRKLLLKESSTEYHDENTQVGDFYFGPNSKPFKVNDKLYQVKCVHRHHTYSKYSDIVTVQFDIGNKYITEKRLYGCFGDISGMVKSQLNYIKITDKLYQCISFYNPRNTGTGKYDQEMLSKIRRQLENMKPQNKIVYARSN